MVVVIVVTATTISDSIFALIHIFSLRPVEGLAMLASACLITLTLAAILFFLLLPAGIAIISVMSVVAAIINLRVRGDDYMIGRLTRRRIRTRALSILPRARSVTCHRILHWIRIRT